MIFPQGFPGARLAVEVLHEQTALDCPAAAAVTRPITDGAHRAAVSAYPRLGRSCPGQTHCPYCPQFGSKPAQFLPLAAALYGPTRSGRPGRSQRERASQCVDPPATGAPGAEAGREARAVGLSGQRVDRALIDRALSRAERAAGVRCHRAATVTAHGLGLETASVCLATRPGPREKSAPCANGSGSWGRAASSSARTKLTCCCSRPCARVGPNGGSRRGWLPTGTNARRVVFGALNVRTGHRLFLVRARQRGEDFRVFLQTLHPHYRGWQVVLVLDGDSAHTAGASRRLAAQLGIELLWLPTRCPELNPLEALWRSGKQTICANRQYPTIDEGGRALPGLSLLAVAAGGSPQSGVVVEAVLAQISCVKSVLTTHLARAEEEISREMILQLPRAERNVAALVADAKSEGSGRAEEYVMQSTPPSLISFFPQVPNPE